MWPPHVVRAPHNVVAGSHWEHPERRRDKEERGSEGGDACRRTPRKPRASFPLRSIGPRSYKRPPVLKMPAWTPPISLWRNINATSKERMRDGIYFAAAILSNTISLSQSLSVSAFVSHCCPEPWCLSVPLSPSVSLAPSLSLSLPVLCVRPAPLCRWTSSARPSLSLCPWQPSVSLSQKLQPDPR